MLGHDDGIPSCLTGAAEPPNSITTSGRQCGGGWLLVPSLPQSSDRPIFIRSNYLHRSVSKPEGPVKAESPIHRGFAVASPQYVEVCFVTVHLVHASGQSAAISRFACPDAWFAAFAVYRPEKGLRQKSGFGRTMAVKLGCQPRRAELQTKEHGVAAKPPPRPSEHARTVCHRSRPCSRPCSWRCTRHAPKGRPRLAQGKRSAALGTGAPNVGALKGRDRECA